MTKQTPQTTQSFETAWQNLLEHQETLATISLKTLFQENSKRFDELSFEVGDILFDFSKQRITPTTIENLCQLANVRDLSIHRADLFAGKKLNRTENRAVLHTLLRDASGEDFWCEGENLKQKVQHELQKMRKFAEALQSGQKKGITGKPFTDLLCLGIGGSELGPALVVDALKSQMSELHLQPHFISNIDGQTLDRLLNRLNPETTLCIISSKTFTTPETLTNAIAVKAWYQSHLGVKTDNLHVSAGNFGADADSSDAKTAHFLAVTANISAAHSFGIQPEHIFEFWEWVGGRYSIWSAVGLPIILSCGFALFQSLLEGAYEMDRHFLEAPFSQNVPVLMALIGIWNNNFLGYNTQAILPYEDALRLLPSYLQQLEMESNGKSFDINNQICSYTTSPILFGGIGCNGQHAYMQLLHQGNQTIPVDFLIPAKSSLHTSAQNFGQNFPPNSERNAQQNFEQNSAQTSPLFSDHHKLLLASCLSQSKALMEGQPAQTADELYKSCPGNRPSTTIMYAQLTPKVLGCLLALYEHKVFVQGIIWGINSFDQWGVELGKKLAKTILPVLENSKNVQAMSMDLDSHIDLDSSTAGLIRFFQKKNRGC